MLLGCPELAVSIEQKRRNLRSLSCLMCFCLTFGSSHWHHTVERFQGGRIAHRLGLEDRMLDPLVRDLKHFWGLVPMGEGDIVPISFGLPYHSCSKTQTPHGSPEPKPDSLATRPSPKDGWMTLVDENEEISGF